jgi:ornithine cyclodeaminase/alanine dehydrogenase-like protein (mu-crystallin family)
LFCLSLVSERGLMPSLSVNPSSGPQRVLLLSEEDVRRLLTMEIALEAVEQGLRKMALDEAHNVSRARAQTDHAVLHTMAASAKSLGFMCSKVYATSRKGQAQFLVSLFDGRSGALLALMQADHLGQMRTGAASGVATKFMARPDAAEIGIFGSGKQARTQLQAICKVRRVRQARVFSPNEDRRKDFAIQMSEACQTEVVAVGRPEMAAEDMDIIVTATTSREPVLQGQWIAQGAHINAIGSNFLGKAELDVATIRRCDDVVVDSKDQARLEAGDFTQAFEDGALHWSDIRELGQIIVGRYPVREHAQDVTLFKSLGIAIEDVAVAGRVFGLAQAEGVGRFVEW